ncbi:phage holin family protein [Alcanivorax sp. S6407]|uniref:HP1 family phage holin n=1 Tax=Alcanivorax sp. S6407 TaxID=2926424 RepID=UPI001FF45957|nr:holin [Alcanivorax sp. S6407]MCK0153874.1 phage holin family protein [Alcanivorax sp. S6407]
MTPKTDTAVSATSYAGAGISVIAGLTLTEWGVIVGIVTAIVTLLINFIYQQRKDRREEKLFQLKVEQIQEDVRDGE